MTVPVFPDPELMIIEALVPQNPTVRFVTVIPAGDSGAITARIRRSSGTNRNIYVDRPIIDIDVFGPKVSVDAVSDAARTIQSQMLSLMSAVLSTGVIQHASTVSGPRQLPEVNPNYVRYNASYELHIHP